MSVGDLQAFVDKWTASGASERANKDQFLLEFCEVLGVPRPEPTTGDAEKDVYVFEKDAPVLNEGGATSVKKIDLYRAGHFILEAKQGSESGAKKLGTAKRNTPGWNQAMNDAFGQALGYARSFEQPEPFIVVCDIGYCFELYSNFAGDWQYRSFPNAQQKRIYLKDLPKNPALVERLRSVFTDPHALDPAKHAAKVTREVAAHLAELAKRLEAAGHHQVSVAKFLMRCLFTMFAEDVGLLPGHLFTEYLKNFWVKSPASFPGGIESLWRAMNTGGHLPTAKVLKFNGGLFAASESLALDVEDIKLLLKAAECDWSDVEPAIFGTLLERALDPEERHKLGAHYTPRAYVERLVRPTIEEPLREEWDGVRVQVRQLILELNEIEERAYSNKKQESSLRGAATKKRDAAIKLLDDFHQRLLNLRILDPACGTGNFLYVAMDTLKRLESEVLAELDQLRGGQDLLHVMGARISPEQFLGIEIKPWAKEIAELVLWIGYLQWHFKQYGKTVQVPEPVLRDYKNIECRDAVLAYDKEEMVVDEEGKPITQWDGKTMKVHPVTGKEVPDESARRLTYGYVNPRKADWPKADFIVGNPPFIGASAVRRALGDGYADALREVWNEVPESADYVMHWWHIAAEKVASGSARRFGLITTNSLHQTFNRRVVQAALEGSVALAFAVPDHPWVDETGSAAVRIAMTVGATDIRDGRLLRFVAETDGGETFQEQRGELFSDLKVGANVASAKQLEANRELSNRGVCLFGAGFIVSSEEAQSLEEEPPLDDVPRIRKYLNGRDVMQRSRGVKVLDLFGLSERESAEKHPKVYQWLLNHVKPERDQNKRESRRRNWWLFGEANPKLRRQLLGLSRYIATVETSKHRVFVFLDGDILPDNMLVNIALDDPAYLAILSSRVHVVWALAAGGRLGVGNDPRYNKSRCFEPFPFPMLQDVSRLRMLGEALDNHRKVQQAKYPELTLTALYNTLDKVRAGIELNKKDRGVHDAGLVSILSQIHSDIDEATFDAYGWPHDLTDEQILERLVALNQERAEEEKRGIVRWLRPDFQNPGAAQPQQQGLAGMDIDDSSDEAEATAVAGVASAPWPKKLPEQIAAIRDLVSPGTSWSATAAAKSFKSAKVEDVQEVMESLASLGILIELDGRDGPAWTAPKNQSVG